MDVEHLIAIALQYQFKSVVKFHQKMNSLFVAQWRFIANFNHSLKVIAHR